MIPESNPELVRNLEGLRNRQAGVPDQLEEDELPNCYARMQRRKETSDKRHGQYATTQGAAGLRIPAPIEDGEFHNP
eukprot:7460072-Heterocapsa_arctica.AAC.1